MSEVTLPPLDIRHSDAVAGYDALANYAAAGFDDADEVLGCRERQLRAALEALAASQARVAALEAGWVKCSDRMPDDDSPAVLVWCPERRNHYTAIWYAESSGWTAFAPGERMLTEEVTHWQPLLSPPKDAA